MNACGSLAFCSILMGSLESKTKYAKGVNDKAGTFSVILVSFKTFATKRKFPAVFEAI